MIKTYPLSILTFADPKDFVFGRRIQGLAAKPFDATCLKKRVLRKTRDKKKGEVAYYIDTRDLDERLDILVGPGTWGCDFQVIDGTDRVYVIAKLTIGNINRHGESEEIKGTRILEPSMAKTIIKNTTTEVVDGKTVTDIVEQEKYDPMVVNDKGIMTWNGGISCNELALLKAGPNALKRAAVHFGIGAYLYEFANINTWEELNQYGGLVNPKVDLSVLPDWAKPVPGPRLVLEELAYLIDVKLPPDLKKMDEQTLTTVQETLANYWGVTTLANGLEYRDYFELAACIARISDYCEHHRLTFDEFCSQLGLASLNRKSLPPASVNNVE